MFSPRPRRSGAPAAVHGEALAVDEPGLRAGQEADGAGGAILAGTLKLNLTADALNQPENTDALTILASTGALTGTFSNVNNGTRLTTNEGWGSFQVSYAAHAVVLGNFAAVDSDNDGIPDAWMPRYFGHAGGLTSVRRGGRRALKPRRPGAQVHGAKVERGLPGREVLPGWRDKGENIV